MSKLVKSVPEAVPTFAMASFDDVRRLEDKCSQLQENHDALAAKVGALETQLEQAQRREKKRSVIGRWMGRGATGVPQRS